MASPGDIERLTNELRGPGEPRLELLSDLAEQPRRIGLLPGSYDPPTVAHVALADAALRDHVDLVVLVYSVRTLPKEGRAHPPLLNAARRIEALVRMAAAHSGSAAGLASHGLLADQAAAARVRFPQAELFLVMGSDKLLQLLDPKWYGDRDATLSSLFAEASVLYAVRSGDERAIGEALAAPQNHRWRNRFVPLDVPPHVAAVSSREVRARIRRGEDVRALVPPEAYSLLRPEALGKLTGSGSTYYFRESE
jgi:nicotinic acid mononucleotide adenylyltransferase